MSFQVSPGVEFTDIDQTNTVPAVSSAVAGYAGHLNWGPVEELVTVSSEKDLAKQFGAPVNGVNSRSFLTASSFLKYSNALRVSRAIGTGALNAANFNPTLIKNKDHFDTLSSYDFIFSARYPGLLGNSIKVSYAYVAAGVTTPAEYNAWPYKTLFDSAPNQSLSAVAAGINTNDEIHVVVIDEDGLLSGTKGTVLEKFEGLSLASNAKNSEGGSIYYKDVINRDSSYVYVESLSTVFGGADLPITPSSTFGVLADLIDNQSVLSLPFITKADTVTTYPGGSTVTTSTEVPLTVTAKSGYVGALGDNVSLIVHSIPFGDAAAKAAHAWIKFGAPVNGDEVVVNGTTFTKAASASGNDYVTISQLTALIEAEDDITATAYGDYILIEASVAGTAGNAFTLALDVTNTGTMEISGPVFKNGVAADSKAYVDATVNVVSAAAGNVTYDITVAVDGSETEVTLQNIIDEINYQIISNEIEDVPALSFFNGTAEIVGNELEAAIVLDVDTLLDGDTVVVLPFADGTDTAYSEDDLVVNMSLSGGLDGSIIAENVITALDMFADRETADIQLLYSEAFTTEGQIALDEAIHALGKTRRDIIVAIAAPLSIASLTSSSAKKAAIIAKFDAISSSSHSIFSSGPVYTYDRYADSYVWIPESGHMLGLCANADLVADPWFSPAGYNRGQLKGVTKLAYNPSKTDRDDLYKKRINSIVSQPGEGILLLGDRTAQTKSGAFDRINVRRLFNVVQRTVVNASKYQLFELNDEFTRATFVNLVEPYLRDVQGRRGIIEYAVICNAQNNTPEVIDRNEFVGDIYIKPAKSINFIRLNFIATRTGVEFTEIVG